MAPKRSPNSEVDDSHAADISGVRSTKRPRISIRSAPIKVIAGEATEGGSSEFFLPEETLVRHSDFAAAAFRNGWQESQHRVIKLPEAKPDLFEIFAIFVSSGKIHSSKENDFVIKDCNGVRRDHEWGRLKDCWLLGDMLQSFSFKDAVADAITQKSNEQNEMPTQLQGEVYSRSVGNNGLRRLIVDFAAFEWSGEIFQSSNVDQVGLAEFFRDTCMRLVDKDNGAENPLENAGCQYHDHGGKKPCYKTMF